MPFFAASEAPPRPESMKFPVNSPASREFWHFQRRFRNRPYVSLLLVTVACTSNAHWNVFVITYIRLTLIGPPATQEHRAELEKRIAQIYSADPRDPLMGVFLRGDREYKQRLWRARL